MIFSNLAGTTSNQFKVGVDSNGQLISNNIYDIYWGAANPSTGAVNPNVKSLLENTDLNDYHTVSHYGQYYAQYEQGSTIIHTPDDVGEEFSLVVSPMTGGWDGFVMQELLHKSGIRYERYYSYYPTPNWSAWKKIMVAPESGRFSVVAYDRRYGITGTATGFDITSQRNEYIVFPNVILMKMRFTIQTIDSSKVFGPLDFKGLPIIDGAFGDGIVGSLSVSGILDGINGTCVSFYASPASGASDNDAFSIKVVYNSNPSPSMYTDTYIDSSFFMNDTNTRVEGMTAIFY